MTWTNATPGDGLRYLDEQIRKAEVEEKPFVRHDMIDENVRAMGEVIDMLNAEMVNIPPAVQKCLYLLRISVMNLTAILRMEE